MIKTDFTITTNHVLGALAIVSAGYVVYRLQKGVRENINKVNPASSENIINQAAEHVIGEENLATAADYFFGAIDLINPWNDSDEYARSVYGLGGNE